MANKNLSHGREEQEPIPSTTVIALARTSIQTLHRIQATIVRRPDQSYRADDRAFEAVEQNVFRLAAFAVHLVYFTNRDNFILVVAWVGC